MDGYGVVDPVVKQLREERIRQGLSAAEVGQRTGMRRAQVTRLEGGRRDLKLSTLRRWALALGLEVVLEQRDA